MSTKSTQIQMRRLQACIDVLSERGIEVDHIHIPDDHHRGPQVYVEASGQLAKLPHAVYRTEGDKSIRIEHHCAPVADCQVRWHQRA